MEKLPLNWFNVQVHMPDNYGYVDYIPFIEKIEMIPLKITGTLKEADYDLWSIEPNAYGVYIRYTDEAVEYHNFNPSEWLADFNTEKAANAFKDLLSAFLQHYKQD